MIKNRGRVAAICLSLCLAFVILFMLTTLLNKPANTSEDITVDYDLTSMSKDMAYSTLCQIKSDFSSYQNKTIKIAGLYTKENLDSYITVYDNFGCCQVSLAITFSKECMQNCTEILNDIKDSKSYVTLIGYLTPTTLTVTNITK